MILGYNSFLGYTPLQATNPPITPSTYTGLKVFGECIIDNIHIVNYTMTDAEINAIDYNLTPEWIAGKTIFLATFDDEDLLAGNVKGLTEPITGWNILRKEVSDAKYTQIATLSDANAIMYDDMTAYSRANFEYAVIPVATSTLGETMLADVVSTDFTSWYLLSEDGLTSYKMCANVNTIARTSNEDVSQKQTVGQFDVFNRGHRDFISSSISFIPVFGYEADGYTIIQTESQMRELELFIKNGLPKIFKTPKGEIWKVYTTNPSFTPVNTNNKIQLDYIDFDYAQIGIL